MFVKLCPGGGVVGWADTAQHATIHIYLARPVQRSHLWTGVERWPPYASTSLSCHKTLVAQVALSTGPDLSHPPRTTPYPVPTHPAVPPITVKPRPSLDLAGWIFP